MMWRPRFSLMRLWNAVLGPRAVLAQIWQAVFWLRAASISSPFLMAAASSTKYQALRPPRPTSWLVLSPMIVEPCSKFWINMKRVRIRGSIHGGSIELMYLTFSKRLSMSPGLSTKISLRLTTPTLAPFLKSKYQSQRAIISQVAPISRDLSRFTSSPAGMHRSIWVITSSCTGQVMKGTWTRLPVTGISRPLASTVRCR